MNTLTKAEEQVMQILWDEKEGFVKDLLLKFPEPKPAYNTVSTIVRILENKGFVDHKKVGKGYLYFAIVSKEAYKKKFMKRFMSHYFQDSLKDFVSFFAKEDKMDISELEELMDEVKNDLKNKED